MGSVKGESRARENTEHGTVIDSRLVKRAKSIIQTRTGLGGKDHTLEKKNQYVQNGLLYRCGSVRSGSIDHQ